MRLIFAIAEISVIIIKRCLGSLMDKTVDSGSTDTGSIPVRDAIKIAGFLKLKTRRNVKNTIKNLT